MKRIALVTGASRGIGAGIATRLARNGYHVLVNHHRGAAAEVLAAIHADGGSAESAPADVSDVAQVQAHYCPTKVGMISMVAAFAVCLGRHGITCNSVLPGTIETGMNADYLATPGHREPLERGTCVGFLGQPDDVSGIVAFLCRPEARYVTGAAILVDGGESVKHL